MVSAQVILDNVDANRERWLELKKNKVSSSNIAAIAGLSKWKSPLEVWAHWTGKVVDEFKGNNATRLGNLLEPFAADLFAEKHNKKIRRANALYANPEYPWAVATPDYFVVEDGGDELLEVKTGNSRQVDRWTGGQCPEDYVAQLQFQMGILGIERGTLSAFLGLDIEGDYDYPFDFDAEMFVLLVEHAEAFLDCVKRDVPPAAGPGDSQLIRKMIKRHERTKQFVDDEAVVAGTLLAKLRSVSQEKSLKEAAVKVLDDERKRLENHLKLMLGENSAGELPDGRTFKVSTVSVKESLHKAYQFEKFYLPKVAA